jgi:hypothetical protein
MYTVTSGRSRHALCLALTISLALLGACSADGRIAAPSARPFAPTAAAAAMDADITDPANPELSIKGDVSISLTGPFGVTAGVTASQKASWVHAEVTASVWTLRNWHGASYSTEITNQCTYFNATRCTTWDDISNWCSTRADDDEPPPGAAGIATGRMSGQWATRSAATTVSTENSCPGVASSSGGGDGGSPSGGSGGVTCYEAWYVWSDGSRPDQFIGIVCFGSGGAGVNEA